MSDQSKQQRKRIASIPPSGIDDAVRQGRKVIFVDGDPGKVPYGYTLVPLRYKRGDGKEELTRVLLPKQMMWYFINKGEGSPDQALDDLADAYGDIGGEEEKLIVDGKIPNAPHADLAVNVKDSYRVYLMNKVLSGDGKGFNEDVREELMLDDPYVANRAAAMGALRLGKKPGELKPAEKKDLEGILVHKNLITSVNQETVTKQEQRTVRCYAGSHWEYRTQTVTTKRTEDVTKKEQFDDVRGQIDQLEREVQGYWAQKGKPAGRHQANMLREYVNLAFIHKENPNADLEITPPAAPQKPADGEKQKQ